MNKFRDLVKSHTMAASALSIGILSALLCGAALLRAQSSAGSATAQFDNKQFDNKQFDNNLIADFRRVEVASVSDALEQLTGQRMYMSHRMHPLFTTKFAGFARTVLLKKDEGNSDPAALSGMLTAIDQGSADSVYVMVVEDGEDIAGMGGLMGTAMAARGYAQDRVPSVFDRHCAIDIRAPLQIWRIANPGDLRRSSGQCGRHCRSRQRRSGRGSQGKGPGNARSRATNGFQRALDVCRNRTIEIDHRGGQEVWQTVRQGSHPQTAL
jgi:hypothetical protein